MRKNKLMSLSILFVLFGVLLFGCSGEETSKWKPSPTFKKDNMILYGTKGKFGIIRNNGEENEPDFPVGQGRHYEVYVLDTSQQVNGKKYKMIATHLETKETVELYEQEIQNNRSGAKFGFDKDGFWKIDVTIDEKPLTSFIVRAEKN